MKKDTLTAIKKCLSCGHEFVVATYTERTLCSNCCDEICGEEETEGEEEDD